MADRFYGYQYGTSPRKLNTEYSPYGKRYPKQDEPVTTTSRNRSNSPRKTGVNKNNERTSRTNKPVVERQTRNVPEYRKRQVINRNNNSRSDVRKKVGEDVSTNNQNVKKAKIDIKRRLKIVMFLLAGFSVLFAISYQNSLISESFNRKEQYKKEMEALSKTNQQLEVSIENNLNLNNIEQAAKEKLGMQKLNNNQKIYVNLPKEDYIAPAAEQIVIDDDVNFFQKLLRGFTTSVN